MVVSAHHVHGAQAHTAGWSLNGWLGDVHEILSVTRNTCKGYLAPEIDQISSISIPDNDLCITWKYYNWVYASWLYFMNTPHFSHPLLHISLRALRAHKQFCTVTLQSRILKTFPRLASCELFCESMVTKRKQAMGTRLFISLALFTSLDLWVPGWEWGLLRQNEVLGKVQL